MAKIEVNWAETPLISVFETARKLGFDLRRFGDQRSEVQSAVKKATVDSIVCDVREAWRKSFDGDAISLDFNDVSRGVYVISIGDGFGVKYARATSGVMYIGRGRIANRLRSHVDNWIFDMSLSLKDVPFKFQMEAVGDGRSKDAFKDLEHLMLERFSKKFGEKPLINKIHGREGRIKHEFSGDWLSPFDNRGKVCLWEIRPSRRNAWFKEMRDE